MSRVPESCSDASTAVALVQGKGAYEAMPPFAPGENYPEYPFERETSQSSWNEAYHLVREALHVLGLDEEHYNSRNWNPLGGVVTPGSCVLLKPNFIREFRDAQSGHGDCLVTHGAVIRAVADYVYIALGGRGRIVVADAPQNDANFTELVRISHLDAIRSFYRRHAGFDLEVYDLRPEEARKIDGVIVGHSKLPGDPAGYVKVNIGSLSMFSEVDHLCWLLYGAEYDTQELYRHHHGEVHEYLISRTVLDADAVIDLPKLKTHKKTGVTINLKNLVGINGNKNWLPHHREGTPRRGGDEFADDAAMHLLEHFVVSSFKRWFPRLGRLRRLVAAPIKALGKRVFGDTNAGAIRSGNWHGNDTTWRMVLDLSRILLYADAAGRLHDRPVRGFFSVVDGIVAGEGNGPLDPVARPCGLIAAGANPVAVDLVCARVMGFDDCRLPLLARGMEQHQMPLLSCSRDDVVVRSNVPAFCGPAAKIMGLFPPFEPHFGWRGHVEISR